MNSSPKLSLLSAATFLFGASACLAVDIPVSNSRYVCRSESGENTLLKRNADDSLRVVAFHVAAGHVAARRERLAARIRSLIVRLRSLHGLARTRALRRLSRLRLTARKWRQVARDIRRCRKGTLPPPTDGTTLVQPADFVYQGAFRLPGGDTPPETFAYGGNAMTFRPDGDGSNSDAFPGSLFVMGHDRQPWGGLPNGNQVAEIKIPQPVISRNLSDLPVAGFIQGFSDVTAGYFTDLEEIPRVGMAYFDHVSTGPKIHLTWGQHLQPADAPSQAWFNPTLSDPQFEGVWFLGSQDPAGLTGYMFDLQTTWADAYASGRYLATGRFRDGGLAGMGPALFAYRPWQADGNAPPSSTRLSATTLLLYENAYNTDQITRCLEGYQHADEWEGAAWLNTPSGKSALIFVGNKSNGAKYWYGYRNLAGSDLPCVHPESVGEFRCCLKADGTDCPPGDLGPCSHSSERGWWSTRFEAQIILYDPRDIARVAAGTLHPWEPQPYTVLSIDDLLYHNPAGIELDTLGAGVQRRYKIGEAAYDRNQSILYVLELYADGAKPVVHVWSVQ